MSQNPSPAPFELTDLARAVDHTEDTDDGIFPPAPAAVASISFDGHGFVVRGRRTFVASGSIHYPRVPRALWRDRLARLKAAGFNTVETYCFWNVHEPEEGRFEFGGEHDLGAFLDLAHEMGLYAIVRVGPYICAEWENGGFPNWLRFRPDVRVREDNPAFLRYVDAWYERLLPLLAERQVHRGGPVLMVQLENEHPQGWGIHTPGLYFTHLREKALGLGIEVPTFFSGVNHGHDPAGEDPWQSAGRTNPWFTTEFWAGWYDRYGRLDDATLRRIDRGLWKILAFGGHGFNFYMLHGGTNFGNWSNNEGEASYDYGAAIGQAGDLRPLYYRTKRGNLFARSFESILETSENGTQDASDGRLRVHTRTSPAGKIAFLDNTADEAVTAAAGLGVSLHLEPGEIVPIMREADLDGVFQLVESAVRILGVARQGETTTLVVYGNAGEPAGLRLSAPGGISVEFVTPALAAEASGSEAVTLHITIPDGVAEAVLAAGGRRVRVLALPADLADHTWFAEAAGATFVVCGPEYTAGLEALDGRLALRAEGCIDSPAPKVVVFGPEPGVLEMRVQAGPEPGDFAALNLTEWVSHPADPEATPSFDDAGWLASDAPRPMGADGDTSAYAWYRTDLDVDEAGEYLLRFEDAKDRITVYVDGTPVSVGQRGRGVRLSLPAGRHTLSVFASHAGRDKFFNYLGPLTRVDAKGLLGPARLGEAPLESTLLASWSWRFLNAGDDLGAVTATGLDISGPEWAELDGPRDVFEGRRGFAAFRTLLPEAAGGHHEVWLEHVDDDAAVYLNGVLLARHQGRAEPFTVSLDAAWNPDGSNVLALVVQNRSEAGGILGDVIFHAFAGAAGEALGREVTGWRMRGGLCDPDASGEWRPVGEGDGRPKYFRARFAVPDLAGRAVPVYRFAYDGLSRGQVWLNGHSLGRYPDRVMPGGLYLPECWLKRGENTLTVFDEEGSAPTRAALVVEAAASRAVWTLAA